MNKQKTTAHSIPEKQHSARTKISTCKHRQAANHKAAKPADIYMLKNRDKFSLVSTNTCADDSDVRDRCLPYFSSWDSSSEWEKIKYIFSWIEAKATDEETNSFSDERQRLFSFSDGTQSYSILRHFVFVCSAFSDGVIILYSVCLLLTCWMWNPRG